MPDTNPIASLYPQPDNNAGATTATSPGQVLQTIGQINALKQFQARQAVGGAFQNALQPDGTMDQGKLAQGLRDPAAALAAPEAINTMLEQRGKQIANDSASFNLSAGQNNAAMGILGGLAQKPNLTYSDIESAAPMLARAGVPASQINGWRDQLSRDPKTLKTQIGTIANTVMGAGNAASRVSGPPDASGAPTTVPLGAANLAGRLATNNAPGDADVIASNKVELANDQTQASNIMGNVRSLQSALPMISQLSNANFGPGSPEFAKVKGALTTAGIIDPNTSDLQVRQQVGKYLMKYAQGAANAGRSDQALSAALGSNPNLDLTQPANLHLVTSQIGMDRADAAKSIAYTGGMASPNQSYKDFKSTYYQNIDPRAFSFDMASPADRRSIIDSLGDKNSAKYQKFARSYQLAKQAGFFTPQGAAAQGQ